MANARGLADPRLPNPDLPPSAITMKARLVIATPHARYATVAKRLRDDGHDVMEITRRDQLSVQALEAFAPDLVFFPHWSWKISSDIHRRWPAIVFHMTDLPFGRGGSPLQNLVRRGIDHTQLSALRCEDGLDEGPIYLKRPLSLLGSAEEILLRAAALIAEMIVEIVREAPPPQPQRGEPVLFTRLRREDGDLARARSLTELFDMVRMLDGDGYPPAFIEVGPFRLEFSRASLKPDAMIADVVFRRREDE